MRANVSTSSVQAPQATIPQFFNFIGSSAGNEQSVRKAPVNIFVPLSTPESYPETQCEPGYYMCPFDGTKKMTDDNPLVWEKRREEVQKSLDQYSAGTISHGTTISPLEEARIWAEVRTVMKEQFAQACVNISAHAKLENTPVAQRNSSKSGNASYC